MQHASLKSRQIQSENHKSGKFHSNAAQSCKVATCFGCDAQLVAWLLGGLDWSTLALVFFRWWWTACLLAPSWEALAFVVIVYIEAAWRLLHIETSVDDQACKCKQQQQQQKHANTKRKREIKYEQRGVARDARRRSGRKKSQIPQVA